MADAIQDFRDEFLRYKLVAERAMEQVSDAALNWVASPDGNSIAMIVRHISGNLTSRFTDFLTSDGEKSWRDRDTEFETRQYRRDEVLERWRNGWAVLNKELASLTELDLGKPVSIRGKVNTVHEALTRSTTHISYHVGQIVLLSRMLSEGGWQWISVPKGMSQQYNQNPSMEKMPLEKKPVL